MPSLPQPPLAIDATDDQGRYTVKRVMGRYTVKPERAAENVELVRAVYDELHGAQAAEGFDMRRSRSRTAQLRPPRRDRG
jgi:hypothetical protein